MPPRTQRTVYSGETPEESLEIALNALDVAALKDEKSAYLARRDVPAEKYLYSHKFSMPITEEWEAADSPYIQLYREGGLKEESIVRGWDHSFDRAFHTSGARVGYTSELAPSKLPGIDMELVSTPSFLQQGFEVPDTIHASIGNFRDIIAELSHDIQALDIDTLEELIDYNKRLTAERDKYGEGVYEEGRKTIEDITHNIIERDLTNRLIEASGVSITTPPVIQEKKSKMRGRPTF